MADRRRLLGALGATAALALSAPVVRAAQLLATPYQGKGPFYPQELPLDQDNDLTRVAGRSERAHGTVLDVGGRLLDAAGRPLAGVQIEIWQVNGYGRYHHRGDDQDKPWDRSFQGFGRHLDRRRRRPLLSHRPPSGLSGAGAAHSLRPQRQALRYVLYSDVRCRRARQPA